MRSVAFAFIAAAAMPMGYEPVRSVIAVGGAYGLTHACSPDCTPAGEWCDECTPGGVPLFPSKPGYVGDGRVFMVCGNCNGTQKNPGSEPPVECEESEEIVRLPGPRWTFEDRGTNPPDSFKISHLASAHGIDGEGRTSSELSALHDNSHNYGDAAATGEKATTSSSCPSGNCPTSSSGGSVRRGLFGRLRR